MDRTVTVALSVLVSTMALAATPLASAQTDRHECTVAAGLGTPVLSASIPVPHPTGHGTIANLGGCTLTVTDQPVLVHRLEPAEGCQIEYDERGDNISEGRVEEGESYPAGTSFDAFCELGVLDAENAITLTPATDTEG